MLEETAACHAVVGTDSFTAHMAALFDCLSLVIGEPVHTAWHVPHERCFYFNRQALASETVAAMRLILAHVRDAAIQQPRTRAPSWADTATRLNGLTIQLGERFELADGPGEDELVCDFQSLAEARDTFVSLAAADPAFSSLMVDRQYLPTFWFAHDANTDEETDRRAYLEARWEEWNNSNLRKYIALIDNHTAAQDW
jgi:hypothetical protein